MDTGKGGTHEVGSCAYVHGVHRWRQKWRRHPWRDRWLLAEAGAWLGLARAAVLILPFQRIARSLSAEIPRSAEGPLDQRIEEARRVAWAIRSAARRTPWNSNCLAQGIAGKVMLRRRGIPSTLYLGVAKGQEPSEPVAGHAWLCCAARIITGAANHRRFTIIATFGEHR